MTLIVIIVVAILIASAIKRTTKTAGKIIAAPFKAPSKLREVSASPKPVATLIVAGVILLLMWLALRSCASASAKEPVRNYILRRQQAYQVRGTPVSRLYVNGRVIDVYRDGSAYEKDGRVK